MGFDNECIPNIQSLPGEYFCPVCRTLIYPNEALQTQCTHLYCKPCLAYIVATTQACPYDGYLVTETDSKPLMESNKSLAETIGKVTVHCLYHRSGCQWQGTLSDCIGHCTSCAFGNSPVVCNRCGTQIIHRQVQEHAQICPGLQPQAQQVEGSQAHSSAATTQVVVQDPSTVASAAPAAAVTAAPATTVAAPTATTAGPAAATTAGTAGATTAATPASAPAAAGHGQAVAQAPTAEQWYQQQLQYQQYYQQQYPGYNPYTQYQQYGQYQQAYQQYMQPQMQVAPQHAAQASVQPSPYVQPQPQVQQPLQAQHMVQSQPQPQPHLQPQLQAQAAQLQPQQQHPQLQPVPQVPQMPVPQTQVLPQLPHPQAQPTAHPPAHTQVGGQPYGQPVTQALQPQVQPHAQPQQQQHLQPPTHQQAVAHQQHPQPQPPHLQTLPQQQQQAQPQMQPHPQIQHQHPQMQLQAHPQPQAYPQSQPMPHTQPQNPSAHAVTGHQSYPQPQPAHQMPPAALQQRPVRMHAPQQGVAPQPVQMRPPQGQFPVQGQQPAILPLQGPHITVQHAQQQPHHVGHHAQQLQVHASIPSQAPQQGFPPQHASVPLQTYQQGTPSSQQQMHPQQPFRPQGPPYMQQHVPGQAYVGHQAQTVAGRPTSHGVPPQQFQHPPSGPVKNLQPATINQQPPMLRSSVHMGVASELQGVVQQHTGQGSLAPVSPASQSGKSEKAPNATGKTEGSELDKVQEDGVGSTGAKTVQSESLGDEKMSGDSREYEFDKVRKDAAQPSQADKMGIESYNADASNKTKVKEDIAGACCEGDDSRDVEDVQGDKEPKAADGKMSDKAGAHSAGDDAGSAMNYAPGDLERGSVQQASQQNLGGLGSHVLQGMGPQQLPYGHPPDMPDAFQRPLGPDRMLPQHTPHPGPMPYHMQGQRPETLPNQMRPPSHNFPENIRPPPMQQPHSSYHSEVAPRAPGQFYGQSQNQMPTPQSAGIRPLGEGMIRPPMGGPLPGAHDTRGPPFAPDHVGRPRPPGNVLEPEANTSGFFDGRQAEPPFIQSGMAKINGVGGGPLVGGAPLHEEGFTSAGEHLRPFRAFPGRHNVNRRDIEEDMKQFSRPAHLDGEGLPRPFERASGRPDGFPDSVPGRPLFPHQPRGPFPTGNGGAEQHPMEFGERHRPIGFHEDFARKPNAAPSHPDLLSSGPEFGNHRIDGMPPLRSPGLFLRGMLDGPGGLRKEQLGSSNLPGNMRHEFDGPEFPHTRFPPGDSFGPRNLHGGVWRGEPLGHGQLRGIEPSGYGYPGRMHPGDPDFGIDYSRHGFPKESGHFGLGGHPRKRGMGWCRICRFNCGSPEDLDLHVQTRDHQQMAMEVVLKMKQDVAKKQKLSSEGPKSFDDKKVAGKANFGGRGNRH